MRDSKPIAAYGVKDKDTLYMKRSQLMTIYVKTPKGRKVTIRKVKPSDSVARIKKHVQKKTGIPPKKQVLQDKNGKTLADNSKPIKKYGVKDKDTLKMSTVKTMNRVRIGKPKRKPVVKKTVTENRIQIGSARLGNNAAAPNRNTVPLRRRPRKLNLRGRHVSQSSTAHGGKAQRAVDGNNNGNYAKQSVTHTKKESKPWWQVDLGNRMAISKVVVWNRVDCCASRLNNFAVYVDGSKCSGTINKAQRKNTIPCNGKKGRKVKVQLQRRDYLSIAEVEVYGVPAGSDDAAGCCGGKKLLSVRKKTTQSSTGHGGNSARAVDGRTDGKYSRGSCTHTKKERSPWWSVDLGRTVLVCKVVVWNRVDCCTSRLNNFDVLVGDDKCASVARAHRRNTVQCGCKRGRTVKVQLKRQDYLTLCEVQVYGTKQNHDRSR
jgi:hypothetical protein